MPCLLPQANDIARCPLFNQLNQFTQVIHLTLGTKAMALELTINGKATSVVSDPDTPLLWVLREEVKLTGTKFSCGVGACGACLVHVDGVPVRSCTVPVGEVAGKAVLTIEGLSPGEDQLSALQAAWIAQQVPQCGYCQSGMIMAAAALLKAKPNPSDADIDAAMTNLCRCGTYPRVRAAIRAIAKS
jgi:isoquinoline 1-oxidoreductase subunit alpha